MAAFASLMGNTAAMRAVQRALASEELAGTYLIVGTAGVGKGAFARAFAQAAACQNPNRDPYDSCGVCASCRLALADNHPDILTIAPAGEQTQIWQFWDRDNRPTPGVLSRTLSYAPVHGRKRVYIIERADTLNEATANSLLKALEEPPPYVLFLALAPHSARVLPTILSRSQTIRLSALPIETLAHYLESKLSTPPERARALANYAEGRVGQGVRLAENPLVSVEIESVLDFAESLPDAPRVRALRVAEQIRKLAGQVQALSGAVAEPRGAKESAGAEEGSTTKERVGRQQLAIVFDLLTAFYRDMLLLCVGGEAESRAIHQERVQAWRRLAESATPKRWALCLDALQLARRRLDANANIALLTEALAMQLLS